MKLRFAFVGVLFLCVPSFGQMTFSVPDNGALSFTTDGSGPLTACYVQLNPDIKSFTPSSFTIIGQRIGGTLVSESGVPGVVPWTSGRIYAEVNAATAGIVITNAIGGLITIIFHLTDSSGTDVSSGSFTVPAGQQLLKFLTEEPFNCGNPFQITRRS